ncbi:MAG TPA: hypothetical protein VJW51_03215 [Candidatus Acidoferrales bacterium]|nr:hypothetical protein [Candidatus Acidoferrales bacterium]
MPLPAVIPVRYTDEEAGFVSVRPVLRMGLRPEQLLELILGVTGKSIDRVEQILRGGSVAASGYRYWWEALEVGAGELEPLLAAFPDADPSRPFESARCILVAAEGATSASALAEFAAPAASRRRTFRRRSFWDALLAAAGEQSPGYRSYSYARRGDLYTLDLAAERGAELAQEARRLGTGEVRTQAAALARAARLVYVCAR